MSRSCIGCGRIFSPPSRLGVAPDASGVACIPDSCAHFIGIHVGLGAAASLPDDQGEMVQQPPVCHLRCRLHDGFAHLAVQHPRLRIDLPEPGSGVRVGMMECERQPQATAAGVAGPQQRVVASVKTALACGLRQARASWRW